MKKKNIFKKIAIVYFLIITLICAGFLVYVVDSLYKYENSDVEKYIANLVVDISHAAKRNKIDNYINTKKIKVNDLEKSNISVSKAFSNIFKTKDITYKLVEGTMKSNPTYDILADGDVLFTITLKSEGNIHRMGLLSFPDWHMVDLKLPNNRGLYYYDINLLEDYRLVVNNEEIDISNSTKKILNEDLTELSKFTKLPNVVKYELNNLTSEPEIKIYDDNNKEIKYTKNHREIIAYELFTTDNVEDLNKKLVEEIDVLAIGEMWSKFLTDDLAGTYHGYSTIKKYLIEDTELWDMAYNWSHGVDITFVSGHNLVGFENESIKNCTIYNEEAFSCEIYLEKNMRLRSGKARKDIMNDKFYFVYNESAWKLVSMKAITEASN